jgi:hypothetical protein
MIGLTVDMPVGEDLKRVRFGDALKDLPEEKARIIRLLAALLAEYASFCSLLTVAA